MNKRLRIGLPVLGALLAISAVAPAVLVRAASAELDETACPELGRPPEAGYYEATERLDQLRSVPWVREVAEDASSRGAAQCLASFESRCDTLRDAAVEAAREAVAARIRGDATAGGEGETDWRAHVDDAARDEMCAEWARWRQWLAVEGLDPVGACPLCGDAP
ncbi:MAG: hypothetical protein H6700_10680 [Myxococcales bacterium]|nr:hypothetical protein [Myxococcales bacterium]MCB9520866.1 hypothetical protein [Myxococcales bacterium]MCB9532220.1 hypothetical protein [Myxococcales bacterium]